MEEVFDWHAEAQVPSQGDIFLLRKVHLNVEFDASQPALDLEIVGTAF